VEVKEKIRMLERPFKIMDSKFSGRYNNRRRGGV